MILRIGNMAMTGLGEQRMMELNMRVCVVRDSTQSPKRD